MTNVFRLPARVANQEVVDALLDLLAQARVGALTGLMHIGSRNCENVHGGICGDFREDLCYATTAATEALAVLMNMT